MGNVWSTERSEMTESVYGCEESRVVRKPERYYTKSWLRESRRACARSSTPRHEPEAAASERVCVRGRCSMEAVRKILALLGSVLIVASVVFGCGKSYRTYVDELEAWN